MDYDFCEAYTSGNRPAVMLKAMLLTDEQIEKYGYTFEGKLLKTDVDLTNDASSSDCYDRALTSAYSFKTDSKGFTAAVTRESDSLVFFSVPYDDGWSATVNGVQTAVEKVNSGFMAVKVGVGDSVIRFRYETPGLITGIKISLISATIFLIYIIVFLILNRNKKIKICYPEGDRLLEEWKSQIISEENEQYEETPPKPNILDFETEDIKGENKSNFNGGFIINTDIDSED